MYFANNNELKAFLKDKIGYSPELLNKMSFPYATQPLVFIEKDAKKFPMLFSFGFTPCIADPENPFYDKEEAKENAIKMFWNDDSVSTEAVLYLLEHNYIPDIYNDKMFSVESSMEEKFSDAKFLLRYVRKEKY